MLVATRCLAIAATCLLAAGCSRQPSTENSGSQTSKDTTTPSSATGTPGAPSPDLRSTTWQLVSIGDKPVSVPDSQRTPHIILQADSKQVSGSGGCNRMFGVYELNGDALRFSGIGSTKMACKDGMDVESAFLPALLRVAKWRVTGQQLELSDSTGAVLARFDARPKQ